MRAFYQFAGSNVLWMGTPPLNSAGIMQAETYLPNPQVMGEPRLVRLYRMNKKTVIFKEVENVVAK